MYSSANKRSLKGFHCAGKITMYHKSKFAAVWNFWKDPLSATHFGFLWNKKVKPHYFSVFLSVQKFTELPLQITTLEMGAGKFTKTIQHPTYILISTHSRPTVQTTD